MEIDQLYHRIENEIMQHTQRYYDMPKIIVMHPNTCKTLFETVSNRKYDEIYNPEYRGIKVYRSEDIVENEFVCG